MRDIDLDLPTPSPSQLILVQALQEGKNISEASAIAFPESSQSMDLALALIEENDFVRARFHLYMNELHLTDKDIALKLKTAFDLAESNPKASTAMLNATKYAASIKGLEAPKPTAQAQINAPITYLTQSQTINNYLEEAQSHISPEEIDKITSEDDILVIETIPKDVLFDT